MKPQRMAAAALSFAHLIGLKRAEEDEDKDTRVEEEDDQDKKDAKADEQDGDENMQSNRAEDGDEKDDEDGDEKDGKKARKAKAEDDDEDKADEEDGDGKKSKASSVRLAVRRERARCAQIIAHGIATGRVRQAGVLAFDSDLSVKAAKATLDAGSADEPMIKGESMFVGSLSARMAGANVPNVGADADTPAPAGMTKVAAAIIAAGEKARGDAAKK